MVPGRVRRRLRFVPVYFHATWALWTAAGRRIRNEEDRERLLSVYGPFAMLCLLALWAGGLLFGFGLLQFAAIQGSKASDFLDYLYKRGTDFHARHGGFRE
jgi:hypothetical protein